MNFIKELLYLIYTLFFTFPKRQKELKIKVMKHFPWSGYSAMCWCGKIICRDERKIREVTKRHETIHLSQSKSFLLWIFYYLSYFWYWFLGFVILRSWNGGYYTNPYEIEAYANEDDPGYTGTNYKKYKYSLKERKRLWETVGGNIYGWKTLVKVILK
jgi:hypothetical protein